MIIQFPYKLATASGHTVIVTNPVKGKYCFKGRTKTGEEVDFIWYEVGYKGDKPTDLPDGTLEIFEDEILHAFWQIQRS